MAVLNVRKVMETHCHIINKEKKDQVLIFNSAQEELYEEIRRCKKEKKPAYFLILKARQLGMSTFTENFGMTLNVMYPNQSMFIMTQEQDASDQLYSMSHYTYENFPNWLKSNASIVKDNQSMMLLTNGSKLQVMVASANAKGTGRGQTFTYAHLSEFDWWGGNVMQTLNGVLSACTEDAIVIIETTANGCGNFKKLWDRAVERKNNGQETLWNPIFFAWFQDVKYESDYYEEITLDKEEKQLIEIFKKDKHTKDMPYEQWIRKLIWRRRKIELACNGDINLFHQEFPSTPEEAFISSGQCIFDLNAINKRKADLNEANMANLVRFDKGYFLYKIKYDEYSHQRKPYDIKWKSDSINGYITLFKAVEHRHPYVLAIDPAGDGSDYTAINVLDNRSSEQVCTLHMQNMSTLEIACQAYAIGQYYNNALIASETNFAPEVMSTLLELGYDNLYVMQADGNDMNQGNKKRFGFKTTQITRPYVISFLVEYVNKSSQLINSYATLIEAENFVRVVKTIDGRTKDKAQANAGQHDDLLMSLGIALYIRDSGQQTFDLLEETQYDIYDPEMIQFRQLFGEDYSNSNGGDYLTYDDIQ